MQYTNVDEAFAKLEELVAKIPEIQLIDAKLQQAKNARQLTQLDATYKSYKLEIEGYENAIEQARIEVWKTTNKSEDEGVKATNATEATTSEEATEPEVRRSRALLLMRAYTELRMTRLHLLEKAKAALDRALKDFDLELNDKLPELALTDDEFEQLGRILDDFKTEYQELYDFCNKNMIE
jgi:hypothetical protein